MTTAIVAVIAILSAHLTRYMRLNWQWISAFDRFVLLFCETVQSVGVVTLLVLALRGAA